MVLFTARGVHPALAPPALPTSLERLLLIGLPLTIVLGFLAALALFPALDLFAAALLAALLAPTDAALGAPVVTNEAVPAETREALNLESGLNDGICVPVVIILLDLAVGTEIEHRSIGRAVAIIAEEIGIGLVVGIVLAAIAVAILRFAAREMDQPALGQISVVALAASVSRRPRRWRQRLHRLLRRRATVRLPMIVRSSAGGATSTGRGIGDDDLGGVRRHDPRRLLDRMTWSMLITPC